MSSLIAGHQSLFGGNQAETAAAILAAIYNMWSFDDDTISETGTGHDISNVYAGGFTYSTGGIGGGKKAAGQQENRCNVGVNDFASGNSHAVGFWLYLNESSDSSTSFGTGNSSVGTDPYGVATVIRSGGVTTIKVGAYDYTAGAYKEGSTYDISGKDKVFCTLELVGGTNVFNLWVGDSVNAPALVSTLTFDAYPSSNCFEATCWRNNGGAAFDPIPHAVDEFFIAGDFTMTNAIRNYLWNNGSGKTYAQIVADAA